MSATCEKVLLIILTCCLFAPSLCLLSDGDVLPLLSYARQLSSSDPSRALRYYKDVFEGASSSVLASEALYESSQLQLHNSSAYLLLLTRSAALGHARAQSELATVYSTGIASSALSPRRSGRAVLLQYFSSLAGDLQANMNLGYRHLLGEGVKADCNRAVKHYEIAANAVADIIEKRGYTLYLDVHRYTESSWSSSNVKHKDITQESIDYFEHMSSEGDLAATVNLANIYLHGTRHVSMNLPLAIKYLSKAAEAGSASAQAQLGYMRIRGGMEVDIDEALAHKYLRFAQAKGEAVGYLGLGIAHWRGIGVDRNISRAMEYLEKIMTKHPDAGYYMAEIIMGSNRSHMSPKRADPYGSSSEQLRKKRALGEVDYMRAAQLYSAASMRGSLLALHRISHMILHGKGTQQSCHSAAMGFKSLAEKSDFVAIALRAAHSHYSNGEYTAALRVFSMLADAGIEVAQANAAYILSKSFMCPIAMSYPGNPLLEISVGADCCSAGVVDVALDVNPTDFPMNSDAVPMQQCEVRALSLYRQSGSQGNGEGYLKMGDHVYYGKGGLASNKEEAVEYYQMAADMRHSHAMFNLGLMYETGDGVAQDFHLAKRYFDEAAATDRDAKMLGAIAVFLLQSHRFLQNILGKETLQSVCSVIKTYLSIISSTISPVTDTLMSYVPSFSRTQAMLTRQENAVHWLQYYAFKWSALKFIMTMGASIRRSIEITLSSLSKLKRSPLEQNIRISGDDVVHEMTILIGLLTLFAILLYVRRARRQRGLRRDMR